MSRRPLAAIELIALALLWGACAPGKDARIAEVLRRARAAPEKIVELEAPYLTDADGDVRAISAWAIGAAAAPGAVGNLEPLVRDPEPKVRRAAAIALCRTGGGASAETLGLLIDDEAVPVRRAVARCFASLGVAPPGGLGALLDDADKEVRDNALGALMVHPDPRALAPLGRVLSTREPEEQLAAVAALRALGDTGAIPALESAAASRLTPAVRERVEATIIELRAIRLQAAAAAAATAAAQAAESEPVPQPQRVRKKKKPDR